MNPNEKFKMSSNQAIIAGLHLIILQPSPLQLADFQRRKIGEWQTKPKELYCIYIFISIAAWSADGYAVVHNYIV